MRKKSNNKRSEGELKRLVNFAVGRVCGFPRPGLMLNIDEIEVAGRPPSRIRVRFARYAKPLPNPYGDRRETPRFSSDLRHPVTPPFYDLCDNSARLLMVTIMLEIRFPCEFRHR